MSRESRVAAVAALVSMLFPVAVTAASQGALVKGKGTPSMASARVSLEVPELIRISGLTDIDLAWDPARQAFVAERDICVFRNVTGDYSVTATSSNGGNAGFLMAGGGGSSVPYRVSWNGDDLSSGSRASRTDADTGTPDCGGSGNIDLAISASADRVGEAARPGLHTDVLVLQVIAE